MFQLLNLVSNNKPQSKGIVTNQKIQSFYRERKFLHRQKHMKMHIPFNTLSVKRNCLSTDKANKLRIQVTILESIRTE